jgi:hypothetical protein
MTNSTDDDSIAIDNFKQGHLASAAKWNHIFEQKWVVASAATTLDLTGIFITRHFPRETFD